MGRGGSIAEYLCGTECLFLFYGEAINISYLSLVLGTNSIGAKRSVGEVCGGYYNSVACASLLSFRGDRCQCVWRTCALMWIVIGSENDRTAAGAGDLCVEI